VPIILVKILADENSSKKRKNMSGFIL
jgi:hypothetical protein